MKSNKKAFKVSALTASLMVAYGSPAFAEGSDDLAQFTKPDSTISVGVGYQNSERAQLGMFDGMRENGTKILLDANVKKRDDATGTWTELRINNLGLDSRDLYLGLSRQGDYGLSAEYSRIVRENQYTFNTGLQGVGTESLRAVAVTPGTGTDLNMGTTRDRYTLTANKFLGGEFEVSAKYRLEKREGLRHFSGYLSATNQTQFLVEPINSTTRQFDLALNYRNESLRLQGGYYGSWYDNANRLITATSLTGAANYISLPPDNKSHQFYLNASYTFTPTTKGTMRVARSIATQNDQSLLTALPAAMVWGGYSGVKAMVVTSDYHFGVSSNVTSDLSLMANLNYQDRKDKTPHVPYNSLAAPDETTPHSFRNLNAKLEASYKAAKDLRLLGGLYLESRDRSVPYTHLNNAPAVPTNAGGNWTIPTVTTNEREVPYRSKNNEITVKAQATKTFSEVVSGSLVYAHGKRNGSKFYWADQQNLINPLHMADRERDKLGLKLDLSPTEALSVQAQYDQTSDKYGKNSLNADFTNAAGTPLLGTGIKDGRAQLFSLDAAYQVNDDWNVTAWYSRDDAKANQYAFQANFGRDPIRKSEIRDIGESFGLGVKGKVSSKLTLGADLQWNRSTSSYIHDKSNDQANLVESLPDIQNTTTRLSLNGAYQLEKSSSLRFDFVYDRWSSNDWTWMMWNNARTSLIPLTYPVEGTQINAKSRQSANFLAVRYIYKFQ